MAHDTKRLILLRALWIVGDRGKLATQLGARRIQLDSWLSGYTEPPDKFFLRVLDILLEDRIAGLPLDDDMPAP